MGVLSVGRTATEQEWLVKVSADGENGENGDVARIGFSQWGGIASEVSACGEVWDYGKCGEVVGLGPRVR